MYWEIGEVEWLIRQILDKEPRQPIKQTNITQISKLIISTLTTAVPDSDNDDNDDAKMIH